MPIEPLTNAADPLEELVFAWQEAVDQGQSLTPEELCRDCPELAPELTRRLRVLRQVQELLVPLPNRPGETSDWRGTTGTSLGGDDEDDTPSIRGYGPLEKIGGGGMGKVYKARNLALDRVEALKMIRSGEFASAGELARFRFEAESTAKLTHSNIVTVHRVGDVNGQPFLAMRWIDGSSLEKRPRETQKKEAKLLAKVARAVHYAHQRGILHYDLKPHNILVDASGEPYVADFGIARPLDKNAAATELCNPVGTPWYMSPEQSRCEPRLTVGSDVFALGVVLYERLTGRLPFTGSNHFAVMERVRDAEPVPPRTVNPAIDRDLEAICLKCLEKDPLDRYSGADTLAADLERYCRGEPVAAQPPGFWDWLRQLARTRPEPHPKYSWQVTVWFGAISLVVNVLVYWMVRTDAPAAGIWAANLVAAVGFGTVLWWYMLRRFRHLPVTERHSLIIAVGHIAVYFPLMAAFVPLSLSAPAREGLGIYPPLAVFSGFGFFILGSTNWSRFFPIGLLTMGLTPVMTQWPESSPLVFGTATALVVWYWSYAKKDGFGFKPEEARQMSRVE